MVTVEETFGPSLSNILLSLTWKPNITEKSSSIYMYIMQQYSLLNLICLPWWNMVTADDTGHESKFQTDNNKPFPSNECCSTAKRSEVCLILAFLPQLISLLLVICWWLKLFWISLEGLSLYQESWMDCNSTGITCNPYNTNSFLYMYLP